MPPPAFLIARVKGQSALRDDPIRVPCTENTGGNPDAHESLARTLWQPVRLSRGRTVRIAGRSIIPIKSVTP
jgi:hypothetical protein